MIKNIILKNHGTYDTEGTSLNDLKAINFIFGSNGSGKTTISRVIDDVSAYSDCTIEWTTEKQPETLVYNSDFVKKHFNTESDIKGIYTFGENVEVTQKIETLETETNELSNEVLNRQKTLEGEDGKLQKRKELSNKLVEDIWSAKQNFHDLGEAFKGVNNSKKSFCERYQTEAKTNKAATNDIENLRSRAKDIYSDTLSERDFLPIPNTDALAVGETAEILAKKIIGKTDVDIASLIEKLNNSDWVQLGRPHFNQLNDQCPFCQQKTDATFRTSLDEYFDESYIADLSKITDLLTTYQTNMKLVLTEYTDAAKVESPFLDKKSFDTDLRSLRITLEANIKKIETKRKELSTPVTLEDTRPLCDALTAHLNNANKNVKTNNETFNNLKQAREELSSEIWKCLIKDTKTTYETFEKLVDGLDKAIASLNNQIKGFQQELAVKQKELEENERKITSIKPTIDGINKLLKSFGFSNFHLAEKKVYDLSNDPLVETAVSGYYIVSRHDGADAKGTLSEGEKSFITFLYFYHLIKGSLDTTGTTTERVVVFDDPVSSLDADILFIVSNLIKGLFAELRDKKGSIKQIFVLTHNIYFHKEITFNKRRSGSNACKDETFWTIRKSSERSKLSSSTENPIKSGYELLWREVRQNPPSNTAVQNAMRRILEHYFKFLGDINFDDIVDMFDGYEKTVCGSLFSWVNDGSHFANDDLFISCSPEEVGRYLSIFHRIFEKSGHIGHYKMMMGDA